MTRAPPARSPTRSSQREKRLSPYRLIAGNWPARSASNNPRTAHHGNTPMHEVAISAATPADALARRSSGSAFAWSGATGRSYHNPSFSPFRNRHALVEVYPNQRFRLQLEQTRWIQQIVAAEWLHRPAGTRALIRSRERRRVSCSAGAGTSGASTALRFGANRPGRAGTLGLSLIIMRRGIVSP